MIELFNVTIYYNCYKSLADANGMFTGYFVLSIRSACSIAQAPNNPAMSVFYEIAIRANPQILAGMNFRIRALAENEGIRIDQRQFHGYL